MSTFKGIWYDGLAEKLVLVSFCFFKKIKIKNLIYFLHVDACLDA